MFLAWKEIKHAKAKFALIMAVVTLVSYLVYFLTSLAYGLASSYTNGVTKWEADQIVLTADANDNVMMSLMGESDYQAITVTGEKAKLGLFPAVIKQKTPLTSLDTREEVYIFGIEEDSFIAPKEIPPAGLSDNQVVVDASLKDLGYELNMQIVVPGIEPELVFEIVGFTEKATYQTAPIVYANLATWKQIRYQAIPVEVFSAVVIQGSVTSLVDSSVTAGELVSYEIQDFINSLPGYTAQVATFSLMIGFLIFIVAFVLAIFIYVLTIQKSSMFGVMKAQGISNAYIGRSVVAQTFIITAIGVAIGLVLTLISGYFLAGTVPFAINLLFYIAITAGFFVFAVFGGLFSVRAVLKIDPLRAIG